MNKTSIGVLRANGIVISNATGKSYAVGAIKCFSEALVPGSKEYTNYLLSVPKSVFITELLPDGRVQIDIGIGLTK